MLLWWQAALKPMITQSKLDAILSTRVEGALREALEPPALVVPAQEARHVVRRAVQHLRLALHERDGEAGRV